MTFVKKLVASSYLCPLVVTLREIKIPHKAENYFISNKSLHLRNILQLLPSLFFSCIKWVYTELFFGLDTPLRNITPKVY